MPADLRQIGDVRRIAAARICSIGSVSGSDGVASCVYLRQQALRFDLQLLHALGGERQFRVRGHVGERGQIGLGAPVRFGIAAAVQVGLGQRIGVQRARRDLLLTSTTSIGCGMHLEAERVGELERDQQHDGVEDQRQGQRDGERPAGRRTAKAGR